MTRSDDELSDLWVVPRPSDRPLPALRPALRSPGKCSLRGPVWGAGGAGRLRSAGGGGRAPPPPPVTAGAPPPLALPPAPRAPLPDPPDSHLAPPPPPPAPVWA